MNEPHVKDQYFKRIIEYIENLDYVVWNNVSDILALAHKGLNEAERNIYAWNIRGEYFSPKEVENLLSRGISRSCMEKRLERGMSRNRAYNQPLQNNGRKKK